MSSLSMLNGLVLLFSSHSMSMAVYRLMCDGFSLLSVAALIRNSRSNLLFCIFCELE